MQYCQHFLYVYPVNRQVGLNTFRRLCQPAIRINGINEREGDDAIDI